MSRCRYNLSEECHNKDCVKCILEKIIERIDFEEKWLMNVKMDNGFISIADIEIAMSGIRSAISELKGDNNA